LNLQSARQPAASVALAAGWLARFGFRILFVLFSHEGKNFGLRASPALSYH
jgi:hypothetical protein